MTIANDISRAVVPVAQASESLARIRRAFDTGTATGSTVLLATAPTALSLLGAANSHYAYAATALGSYAISMADRAIAGRGLDIAKMGAGDLVTGATDVLKMAGGSGLIGGKAGMILNSALQLQGAVTRAYHAYQALGGLTGVKNIISPSGGLPKPGNLPGGAATGAAPHLLILSGSTGNFYFGLSTAAFDKLTRDSGYNIAALERLGRRQSLQFVAINAETIRLEGVVFGAFKGGIGQFEKLRAIAQSMQPVNLTTGYGQVLGRWYIMRIEEAQDSLMQDGKPRKQAFTLELSRYGDDYQKL